MQIPDNQRRDMPRWILQIEKDMKKMGYFHNRSTVHSTDNSECNRMHYMPVGEMRGVGSRTHLFVVDVISFV